MAWSIQVLVRKYSHCLIIRLGEALCVSLDAGAKLNLPIAKRHPSLLNSLFDLTLVYRQSRLEGFRSDLVFGLGIGVAIAVIDQNSIESAKEVSGNT